MIRALRNALTEARGAAHAATGFRSKCRLAIDFITSRLLRAGKCPGYNRLRKVTFDGMTVHYRFNRGDLQSLREVFLNEVYELNLPFRPRTILDLGANIGLASLWMGRRFRPDRVIAVEPEPGNAAVAIMNFASNKLAGEVIPSAVARSSGKAQFKIFAASNLGHITSPEDSGATPAAQGVSQTEIETIGIDDLLRKAGPDGVDLVKMDIEGTERNLLGDDLSWLTKIRALMVEFHDQPEEMRAMIGRVETAGFFTVPMNAEGQENLMGFIRKVS